MLIVKRKERKEKVRKKINFHCRDQFKFTCKLNITKNIYEKKKRNVEEKIKKKKIESERVPSSFEFSKLTFISANDVR